jgi:RNA polymerase sigma-32 factor
MWLPPMNAYKGFFKGEPTMKGRIDQMSKAEPKLPAKGGTSLPSLSGEQGLNRYLAEIKKFPVLTAEQEYMLAKRYAEHQDPEAAAQLVTSHLRLVAKIAMGYRGYGLPVSELISEGNIGLMQGVKKFEPERGFRLATYAMWWIKASIQEFILRSWSLVKMGTTAAQKKLFFNLRRMKKNLDAYEDSDLHPDQVKKIATDLGVSEQEVVNMNRRMMMGGDASLNISFNDEGEGQWQDLLEDNGPLQDQIVEDAQEAGNRHALLVEAMDSLNDRERHILTQRRLTEDPRTLEELSQEYNVSRERVRQIEVRAFEKLQKAMLRIGGEKRLLPAT